MDKLCANQQVQYRALGQILSGITGRVLEMDSHCSIQIVPCQVRAKKIFSTLPKKKPLWETLSQSGFAGLCLSKMQRSFGASFLSIWIKCFPTTFIFEEADAADGFFCREIK